MTLAVRRAGRDEFAAIWPIFHAVVVTGDTYAYYPVIGEDAAADAWFSSAEVFVAEADGQIVGTYRLGPNQPGLGSHVANAGYMVSPAHRGAGVASAMCAHSLDRARAVGFTAMQFNFIVSTNTRAIELWERFGFTVVGRVPNGFCHRTLGFVDVLIMYRSL